MPREARAKSRSGIYHVILRGANRQEIFHDDEDCLRFLETIKKYMIKTEIQVYSWCLMNNHVHLLLKEGNEPLSITMKRIGVSFVTYYHWKYSTTGHLFQDRFKSEKVESLRYLLTVTRYIHQNPVKAGIVERVDEWKWSSCQGYYGESVVPSDLLNEAFILSLFSEDVVAARKWFREFNERKNNDQCLEGQTKRHRITDAEARFLIKDVLGEVEIVQVKGLSREERIEVLKKVKSIKGVSQRQAARILGVSPSMIFKA